MAVAELLDALGQATAGGAEEPAQRLEIFDYAVASTLEPAES